MTSAQRRPRPLRLPDGRLISLQLALAAKLTPFLKLFGVDRGHFLCLLRTRFALESRPGEGEDPLSFWRNIGPAFEALLFLALAAFASIMFPLDLPGFSVMMAMSLLIMLIVAFSMLFMIDRLFDVSEWSVLGTLPISGMTILATRTVYIAMRLGFKVFFFCAIPLIVGTQYLSPIPWLIGLTLTAVLSSTLSLFAILVIYLFASRLFPKRYLVRIVAIIQSLALFMLWMGPYAMVRSLGRSPILDSITDPSVLTLWFPPCHYAGLYLVLQGDLSPQWVTLSVVGIALPFLLLTLGFRLAGRSLVATIQSLASLENSGQDDGKRRNRWFERLAKKVTKPGPERVGFRGMLTIPWRDRNFLLRVLPSFLSPFLFLFLFRTPQQDDNDASAVIMVFAVVNVCVQSLYLYSRFTTTPSARWMFVSANLERPEDVLSGTYKAILYGIAIPYILLLSLVTPLIIPIEIHELVVVTVASIWIAFGQLLIFPAHFPFAERFQQSKVSGQAIPMLIMMMGSAVVVGGGYALAHYFPMGGALFSGAMLVSLAWFHKILGHQRCCPRWLHGR